MNQLAVREPLKSWHIVFVIRDISIDHRIDDIEVGRQMVGELFGHIKIALFVR